jgi:dTDP-4-dehydrorhamnose reductase
MKIFITGISGLVGGCLARVGASAGHRVIGSVGSSQAVVRGAHELHRLDLRNLDATEAAIRNARPDVIINAAAVSEPAKCEADPVTSHRLNVDMPERLASVARDLGARLIHLSSEQAFDGTRAPYRTTDPVSPINLYASQKVESEKRVHATAPKHAATVRAPLLMGNSVSTRRSLHERLLADWVSGRTPRLFTDEFRQTCTAENLAEALLELSERSELVGVYHWAGADVLSRYEQGVRVREHFGLPDSQAPIVPTTRAAEPQMSAKRQANLALDLEPLATLLRTKPEQFQQQLRILQIPEWAEAWVREARGRR